MDDQGLIDSAILLMSIGEEQAAEVFKFLAPKEVQKIGETMARLRTVDKEKVDNVLSAFAEHASSASSLVSDSDAFVRSVLNKALGEEKAGFLIDRILAGRDVSGIEGLKWMDADTIAELIRNEHPQIIASILVHLEQDQSGDILSKLGERHRNDILIRIATIDGIQPNALAELNDVLSKIMAGSDKLKKAALGGVKCAAGILNFMGASVEQSTLEAIRSYDPDLATKVEDQMFTFENMLELDDKAIQLVLREIQTDSLTIALKGARPELAEKIFKNMSTRAAEMLKEDLESRGPVKVSDVESEQKEILKAVRRLAEDGQISLGGKSDDAYI
jgi:flagellar motor switch protein FliG